MKNKLLLLSALVLSLSLTQGCKSTSAQSVAIRAEGSIVVTVDTGMKVWATYANSGKATQAQIDSVHKAYDAYYNSQILADAALTTWVNLGATNSISDLASVNVPVQESEAALLALLNLYMTPNAK